MSTNPNFEHGQHLDEIHRTHNEWQENLSFILMELDFYQRQLATVNSADAVEPAKVEQLQNRVILLTEQTQILAHDLRKEDDKLGQFADQHEGSLTGALLSEKSKLAERLEMHQKIYDEFKKDFYLSINTK